MTNALLNKLELQTLMYACQSAGAATYLCTEAVDRLKRLGLVEDRNEHSVKATPAGRSRWLGDGA